ncbi:MAG: hypothetical protein ABIF11_10265 [Nitrospirota bacterium]
MRSDESNNLKGEATILYSGGTDSALAAVYLCEQHRKITLLTMRPHNFMFFRNKSKILAARIIEKFGKDKVIHKYIDSQGLMKKIVRQTYLSGIFKFGLARAFDFCSACGSSIHTMGIIYNLENRIHYLALGFTEIQSENDPATSLQAAKMIAKFAKEYNIEFLYPVFNIRETDAALFKLGIVPREGLQSRRNILTGYPFIRPTQGSCLLPWLRTINKQGFAGPIFGTGVDTEQWRCAYIEKEDICRRYIQEYFAKKGLSLEELVTEQANLK